MCMIPLMHRPEDINTYITHSCGLFSRNCVELTKYCILIFTQRDDKENKATCSFLIQGRFHHI